MTGCRRKDESCLRRVWPVACAGLLLVAIPWLSGQLDRHAYDGGRSRDTEQRQIRNSSSMATILGEFRTSASDIMFIKTDRYLHGGIGYAPHHDADESHAEVHDDGDPSHAHGSVTCGCEGESETLLPTRERDYRGFIGMLHRSVKPWQDPSKPKLHTDGTELLPWFRVMTVSDPHYVKGYTVGAWWLKDRNPAAAMAFVDEGIRNNPADFQVHLTRALLLVGTYRDYNDREVDELPAEVLGRLIEAKRTFQTAAELAIRARRGAEGGAGDLTADWSQYQESDAMAACQMAVVMEQRYGEPSRAAVLARKYLRVLPDNVVLRRALE